MKEVELKAKIKHDLIEYYDEMKSVCSLFILSCGKKITEQFKVLWLKHETGITNYMYANQPTKEKGNQCSVSNILITLYLTTSLDINIF